jgi:hypothetical protein
MTKRRPAPGRNDPCPCGSGQKFKRCCGRPDSNAALARTTPDLMSIGVGYHAYLAERPAAHRADLSKEFAKELEIILEYERFLCGLTAIVGRTQPTDEADRALRDLLAETFDMLYAARSLIFDGFSSAPFPLLRRAFECICLFHYVLLNVENAKKWVDGSEISNGDIRKFMSRKGLPEYAESLRKTYGLQSRSVHPNRGHMVMRRLGEGCGFSLAGAGSPPQLIVAHYLQELIDMWAWFSRLAVERFSSALGEAHREVARYEDELSTRALATHEALRKRVMTLYGPKDRQRAADVR